MMKILTQKMLGAQGQRALCRFRLPHLAVSFTPTLSFHLPSFVISSEARNLLSAGAGKQQVPRRIRSSE
jgi:hypothetical protein